MSKIDYKKAKQTLDSNERKNENQKINYKEYSFDKNSVFKEENKFNMYNEIHLNFIEDTRETLTTSFPSRSFDYNDYDWIKKGLDLVTDDKCEFCKSELSPKQLQEIRNYLEDKTSKARNDLISLLKFLNNVNVYESQNYNVNNKFFSQEISNRLKQIDYDACKVIIDSMKQNIEKKLEDLTKIIDESDIQEFEMMLQELNKKFISNNLVLQSYQDKLLKDADKFRDITKLLISESIVKNNDIYAKNKTVLVLEKENTELKKKLDSIEDELNKNKMQLKDTSKFVTYFNSQIKQLNYHFYLTSENDNYMLRSREVDNITLSSLSEGEQFMFAFIYFYYQYMHEYSQLSKMIVIDDPFTSLDKTNKYYIEGMLLNFVRKNDGNFDVQNDSQVFILTHHYDFFIDLISSGLKNSCSLLLENSNKKKTIRKTDSTLREYKIIFNEIINFVNSPSEEESIKIGNYIRRCIETFMQFYFDVSNVSKHEEYSKLFKNEEQDYNIIAFLKFINSHSHSFSEEFDYDSIKKFSKVFDTLFKTHYNEHYESMTN